jgi:hypothetical protein
MAIPFNQQPRPPTSLLEMLACDPLGKRCAAGIEGAKVEKGD